MDNPIKILEAYFKERNVDCMVVEPVTGTNAYKNMRSFKLITNGVSIVYFDGYRIKSIQASNTVWPNKLDTPEEVFKIVVNAISGTLSQKVNFILDAPDFFTRQQRLIKLQGTHKDNYRRRKSKVDNIIRLYTLGTIDRDKAYDRVKQELSKPYHARASHMLKTIKEATLDYLGDITLPVPLPKEFMLSTVRLDNFIMFETLSSFPWLINHAIAINEGKAVKDAYYVYDYFKYSATKRRQLIRPDWIEDLKDGQLKHRVVNFCINYLKVNNEHQKLVTNNPLIWDQLFILYGIRELDPTLNLPKEFVSEIRKYQMIK